MKLLAACFKTHNAEEMVAFYSKVFGYAPMVDGEVDFRFQRHQLTVFRLTDKEEKATESAALIYDTDEVDAEYERLHELGITDEPPTDKPWGVRSFMIADPDGNTVSFAQQI